MLHDLRSSLRTLRRRPLHTLVAATILALGLSAATAVFSYLNAFSQPFPGVDSAGVLRLSGVARESPYTDISYPDFLDYARTGGAFEGFAATQPFYAASVKLEAMTEVAFLEAVSGDYFRVLGARTVLGRALAADDDRPGAAAVAVISHAWWQRSFGAQPSVLNRTIYLNARPFTVVGVAAPEFLGTDSGFRPDVWIPLAPFADRYTSWAQQAEKRDVPLVRVYARLRRGASPGQGLAQLQTTASALDQSYPRTTEPRAVRLTSATWIDARAQLAERPMLTVMVASAGVLLLLVCANVANLLLAVATGREHEVAIRASLGASPGRLMRVVIVENLLLALLAGAIALALAGPASARLGSYFARPSVWGRDVSRVVSLDWRVAGFALLVSAATGVIASLLPAVRAGRRDLVETLKRAGEGASHAPLRIAGRAMPGLDDLLVATQIALAVVLVVVAGLVVRTLDSVARIDPGFAYEQLVVTHISTSSTTLTVNERDRFFREVAARVALEPWVTAATVADFPLLSPHPSAEFRLDGDATPRTLTYSKVLPGFVEALRIGVVRGRSFAAGDSGGAPDVAMINERLAARYFPEQDPVGRRIWWPSSDGTAPRPFEIVGIVRDTKTSDYMGDVEPTVYFSFPQHSYPSGSALIVAVRGDPRGAVPMLQTWLRDVEPFLAIINVIPYRDVVRGFMYTQRMNAELFSALAVLGLVLAAAGIFSVLSLAVGRRRREIGVRMAIGARRRDIEFLFIRRAMIPVVLGLSVGLLGALALSGLVRGLLYGVEANDPLTVMIGSAVLVVAALAASYLPARRAAAVDPVEVLRQG